MLLDETHYHGPDDIVCELILHYNERGVANTPRVFTRYAWWSEIHDLTREEHLSCFSDILPHIHSSRYYARVEVIPMLG